ncbi:hypothetical protein HYU10_01940 [Candidatus Woesearchaeota archaeon]|nr:hypothetical protein [Candidatus Woesearchaeota archaeon]MBI2661440.1 hypothetical protein [Candidatus Woesearchaeota archaeon]
MEKIEGIIIDAGCIEFEAEGFVHAEGTLLRNHKLKIKVRLNEDSPVIRHKMVGSENQSEWNEKAKRKLVGKKLEIAISD